MDLISNTVVKLKNASRAQKPSVSVPYSKLSEAALRALARAGFVGAVAVRSDGGTRTIEVALCYINGVPVLTEAKRVSKPSRRLYTKAKEVRRVRHGYGALFLTTSRGVFSDREARKEKIGGEPLFIVW